MVRKATASKRPSKKPVGKKPAKKVTGKKPARAAVKPVKARANADAAALGGKLKPWTTAEVTEAFRRFQKVSPEPKGELEHVNAFTLLCAVVMSAQATDAGVNRATRPLFATVDTPEKMVALGEERLREAIKTIGLFRMKAKNVIGLSERLITEYGGEVPASREALEALPGVGRKTANVVLNMAYGMPTMAVDTHVFRVGNRTGLAPGKNPLEVELGLEKAIPAEFMLHAHHWLILHGRYVCKAQRPLCETCIINDLCRWPGKTVLDGNMAVNR
jgi:endonuclease III